jgi:predicted short-subunit dehydrogenase-like oxidoreductase (DUF2520 family)
MKYGIAGLGNLGTTLAVNLFENGFNLSSIYSRKDESVKQLNELIKTGFTNNLRILLSESDIVFLTVNDSSIKTVSKEITEKYGDIDLKGKLFIHMSGIKTSDEMLDLKKAGALVCSLHPIQTFPCKSTDTNVFNGISCGFEGDKKALSILSDFISYFNIKILNISKDKKVLYHAAAVVFCNFMSCISYMGEELAKDAGIDKDLVYKAFKPLMEKTLENIAEKGAVSSLSGPAARKDTMTIQKHIEEIKKSKPGFQDVYNALTDIAREMTSKKDKMDGESYE